MLCIVTIKVMMEPRVQQSLYLKRAVADQLAENVKTLVEAARLSNN